MSEGYDYPWEVLTRGEEYERVIAEFVAERMLRYPQMRWMSYDENGIIYWMNCEDGRVSVRKRKKAF